MTSHKNIQSANMAVVGGAKFFLAFGASSRCILRPFVEQATELQTKEINS